ncbi:MAG: hypothetical protein WCX28_06205 [Bacteriovoracaceae bacterium]|nr:hypothetical protein [Bacteroidota bacterium]
MKTILLLISLIVISGNFLPAQQRRDSIPTKRFQRQNQKFMDENGDGVHDKKMNGARDRFIDANGDGICDSRERGLGFRRDKNQSTHQTGKQQRGKK